MFVCLTNIGVCIYIVKVFVCFTATFYVCLTVTGLGLTVACGCIFDYCVWLYV